MNVRQLSVVVENEAGRVSEVTDVLGRAGVNIRGFAVSDTADDGVVRLVVDDPDRGRDALQDAGFAVKVDDVLCIELVDQPGDLAGVLKIVSAAGVNIEYVYNLIGAYVVIDVADIERATAMLRETPIKTVGQDEIAGGR